MQVVFHTVLCAGRLGQAGRGQVVGWGWLLGGGGNNVVVAKAVMAEAVVGEHGITLAAQAGTRNGKRGLAAGWGARCVPVTGEKTEGEEGEEGVVSGWIAAFVKAAAARRKAERRIDVGELSRVVEEERRRRG